MISTEGSIVREGYSSRSVYLSVTKLLLAKYLVCCGGVYLHRAQQGVPPPPPKKIYKKLIKTMRILKEMQSVPYARA